MTQRRAVLYGRVSKLVGTGEGKSVDQQLSELRAIAGKEQVEIVAEHRDDGISASRYAGGKSRAGWIGAMTAINDGSCTELWVWEISRATRDRPVWAKLVTACIAQDVKITIAGRVHDPADPDDGFMLDLGAALAVRESAVTSKRIKRDVRAAAAAGLPHGRLAYGYAREYDPHTRALVRQRADEETGPIVAEIVRRVAAGDPGYAIAADLTARGVPSPYAFRSARLGRELPAPQPWTLEQVHRIARNPTYAGLRSHKGAVTAGTWDPIVSLEEHGAAVARLSAPGRRNWTDASTKHLLTGIAKCGVCGSRCRLTKNRGYPSYSCWGGKGTGCVARIQDPVDELVEEAILARMERPEAIAQMAAAAGDDTAAEANRELAALEQRLAELADLVDAQQMTATLAGRVEAKLLPQLEEARRRAVQTSIPPEVLKLAGPGARGRWAENTMEERRRIVRALVEVTIHRSQRKHGTRGFDPNLIDIRWL